MMRQPESFLGFGIDIAGGRRRLACQAPGADGLGTPGTSGTAIGRC